MVMDGCFFGKHQARTGNTPAFETFFVVLPDADGVDVGNFVEWHTSQPTWKHRSEWEITDSQSDNDSMAATLAKSLAESDWLCTLDLQLLLVFLNFIYEVLVINF